MMYKLQQNNNGLWETRKEGDIILLLEMLFVMRKLFGDKYRVVDEEGNDLTDRRENERGNV